MFKKILFFKNTINKQLYYYQKQIFQKGKKDSLEL